MQHDMKTASERKLRQATAPYPVEALFSFPLKEGGEEFRMAPLVYVQDLENLVLSLLEENETYFYLMPTHMLHIRLQHLLGLADSPGTKVWFLLMSSGSSWEGTREVAVSK